MIGPRSNFWGTLWTLVFFFVIERLAKPIWDVEVQDLWKDTAHPAIRDRLWPWVRTLLEWTGPYWAGVISAVSLMLVVEIFFARLRSAKQNVAPPAITDDLTDRIPLESSASQIAIPPKALPSVRRLAKRADSMELAAIVQTENRVYVLSNWQPEGADFERIRVDALLKNGLSDADFGLEKSGFISFNLTRSIKSNAQRVISLADGTLLLAGSSFNEETQMSSAFLAKIDIFGSLVTNFGTAGVLVLPRENTQACVHDAAEADGYIYCIVSNNQSADITVLQMTSTGELVDEHRVPVAKSGIVWPSRIVRTFPDNGFLIAGKISTANSASMDGFVVKIDANISIDKYYGHEGVVLLGETFSLPSVHQLIDLIVLPTGNVLVAGTGNEGFVVALNPSGAQLSCFGRFGVYESHATYRTTATSLSYSSKLEAISLAGTESDGNSINRPFVNLLDTNGLSLLPKDKDPAVVSFDGHSFISKHIILNDGCALVIAQEGPISLGRRNILVAYVPLIDPTKI